MEITVGQLFHIFLKRWYVVVATVLIFAIVAFAFVAITAETTYRATSRIYLSNPTNSVAQSNFSSLEGLRSFSQTYIDLMQSREVFDRVRTNSNTTYTDAQFKSMIRISNNEDSLVYTLTLTTATPEEAVRLLNIFAETASNFVTETVGVDFCKGEVIDKAIKEGVAPVRQSPTKTALIAGLVGAILSYAVLFVLYITDTTIRTKEDLVSISELPLIGVIPDLNTETTKKQKGAIY